MKEREIGYESVLDPLQTLPDGLDDPYMILFAFSRLGQANDSGRKRTHRWPHRSMLEGATARLRAAAIFALTGLNPNAPKVVRGAGARALAAEPSTGADERASAGARHRLAARATLRSEVINTRAILAVGQKVR